MSGAGTKIGNTLQQLFSTLEDDVLQAAAVPVRAALVSIKANPSQANIVAQGAALAVALPTALPTLQAEAAKQLVDDGLKLLNQYAPAP